MPAALQQTGTNVVTPRSSFILRFISTVGLWTIALLIMFSGYEILFWLLISAFGMIGLWEFYRMLDHKRLPNFKITGMICGAVLLAGSFYYFSKIGPAHSYDFEVAVLLFFLLTVFGRQMFARLRNDEPLQTMAYTLFGLLYVLWLYNFITKIVYLTPRSSTGQLTGQDRKSTRLNSSHLGISYAVCLALHSFPTRRSSDLEVAVLLFFLLTVFGRQMFARLRNDEPLQTMAYTLFGLLYVLWLYNFITKIVYLTPRSSTGQLTG